MTQLPPSLPPGTTADAVKTVLGAISGGQTRPSAHKVVVAMHHAVGAFPPAMLQDTATWLADARDSGLRQDGRAWLRSMLGDGIDELLRRSKCYRSGAAFRDMVGFMARFREYKPYNNMLVRLQDPACGFFATEVNWHEKFKRWLSEDARPLLILAPRHPVLLVYALDQTDGPPLPRQLLEFTRFEGRWDPAVLRQMLVNAEGLRIRVEFKPLSSTLAGFATWGPALQPWKRRIVVHAGLDERARFAVLVHELAHVLLGHLGGDEDQWWPSRLNLDGTTREIEVESVAFLVTSRVGLAGTSDAYLARYVGDGGISQSVSLDTVAKVASTLEDMARKPVPARKPGNGRKGARA